MKAVSVSWFVILCVLSGCGGAGEVRSDMAIEDEQVSKTPEPNPPTKPSSGGRLLFLGDSLTAGYGLRDVEQAFPDLLQKKIDGRGWDFEVVNGGISGDTTSSGLRRVDWFLDDPVDLLFLELGANDGLRGISLDLTEENLQGIIDRVRERYPNVKVIVAGMMVPPNLGRQYTSRFSSIFEELADRFQWVGYLSTTGVYGDHNGAWVDESAPLTPATRRGRARVTTESEWQALARDHGLALHIFRLPGIYGPGRGPFEKVRNGTARRIIKEGQVFSRIHVAPRDSGMVENHMLSRERHGAITAGGSRCLSGEAAPRTGHQPFFKDPWRCYASSPDPQTAAGTGPLSAHRFP